MRDRDEAGRKLALDDPPMWRIERADRSPTPVEVATVAAPMYAVWTVEYSRDFCNGKPLNADARLEVRQMATLEARALIAETARQMEEDDD